ncbi:hypothetical protein AB0M36_20520 [Actinoplanes sp. NPDC051346]|uniref:hypothetical protein n=1 Tax=Actinoplanes sp. NPDC051346 TaxID=3155048 RepID=UPI003444B4C2
MTTQTPYGPPNAEHPRFGGEPAQYPPAGYPHHAPAQHGTPGMPHYPQEGAAGYPQAVAYQAPPIAPGQPEHTYPAHAPAVEEQAWYQHAAAGQAYPEVTPDAATTSYPGFQHSGGAHQANHAAQTTAYPPSAYPTAPPWAAGQPAAPAANERADAAVVHPYGVVPQVGGLMVPYPEEMRNAPRAQAPALWPVAAFTFFFGVWGAISASRRAGQARRGRNSVAPYWVTFGVMLAVSSFFWLVAAVSIGVPLYASVREGATVAALEENVLHDGQLEKANVSASSADCRAAGEWIAGQRDFMCELELSDGRTGRVLVTSDDQGNWRPLEDR